MQKTPAKIIIWQTIEQSKPKQKLSAKFSKEEVAYLEWIETRDNDKILQSISWKQE